jgi:hypothetical protein
LYSLQRNQEVILSANRYVHMYLPELDPVKLRFDPTGCVANESGEL